MRTRNDFGLLSSFDLHSTSAAVTRFYPFRATFDFECFSDGENLPADSDRVQCVAHHVSLSVSLASNIPGHETPRCYVTDGDSAKWMATMMSGIVATSDAAFNLLILSYDNVPRVECTKGGMV